MRRAALLVALLATLGLILAGTPAAAAVPQHRVTLTGAAETAAADPNGRGQFTWTVDGTRVCYLLSVRGVGTILQAHIHRARAGVDGPVVVPLDAPTPASAACATVSTALATALRTRPARFYVNVHNARYGAGALRAQLR